MPVVRTDRFGNRTGISLAGTKVPLRNQHDTLRDILQQSGDRVYKTPARNVNNPFNPSGIQIQGNVVTTSGISAPRTSVIRNTVYGGGSPSPGIKTFVKSPVGGTVISTLAGLGVGALLHSPEGRKRVWEPWVDLLDHVRPFVGNPKMTPAQKEWFKQNPGVDPTPQNGFPPNSGGTGTASPGGTSPNTPNNPNSPNSPNSPSNPGSNNPSNPNNPASPNTPNNQRPGLPPNLPINPSNPNRPNTNIPDGFQPGSPSGGSGLGNPGGNETYNFPPIYAPIGFTIRVHFWSQFWQNLSGGRSYPEGAPSYGESAKTFAGIPKRLEVRTVNYRRSGNFDYYNIEAWLVYKPNQYDPEIEEKIGGFSHSMTFRFLRAESFYQPINAPVENVPTQPDSPGMPGQPDFVAPPMFIVPPSDPSPLPAQPKNPPQVAPPVMPITAPANPRIPFRSPQINPVGSPTGNPTGNPTPNPAPNPAPTGNPSPGTTQPLRSPSPTGVGVGTAGNPSTQSTTNTGGLGITAPNNAVVPQRSPQTNPLTSNPVNNQGGLSNGAKEDIEVKKAPIQPPNQVTPNLCQDPCVADLQRKAKDDATQRTIEIPVFTGCELDEDGNKTGKATSIPFLLTIPAAQASFAEFLGNQLFAMLEKSQCTPPDSSPECVAAIPDWWQIRLGADIPQLVVQYAEQIGEKNGKPKYGAPKYVITIPHYQLSYDATTKALFPSYTKGSRMGVLICNDNSKLIVNAEDEAEANRVLNQLQSLIAPAFTEDARINNGDRRGTNLKTLTVHPRIAKFFSQGQKNTKPDWIKYFND
jgi:hypothetical protein